MRSVRSRRFGRVLRAGLLGLLGSAGVFGAGGLLGVGTADATVVRFQTDEGTIDLTLYDAIAPATVANFLGYVNSGRYDGTFIHRSVPGFIVQGGGFTYNAASNTTSPVPTDAPVVNEFNLSNTRGTVAMAKLGGNPDSATSQWFFNLADNSSNLDAQNGGFTVFARVMGNGMQAVDDIAALPRFDLDGPLQSLFDSVPLEAGTDLSERLVFVTSATVLNLLDGDADMDGLIAQADLDAVLLNWGNSGAAWDTGDFNGNNVVEQGDLDAVLLNWGSTAEPDFSGSSVPEPATAVLLGLSGVALAGRRRGVRV